MRKLPKQGYYVFNYEKCVDKNTKILIDISDKKNLNIVYCSGATKGNFYWNPKFHSEQWNSLLWTCTPSVKESEEQYDYYEINPIDVDIPN
jgi:hypothetical protein